MVILQMYALHGFVILPEVRRYGKRPGQARNPYSDTTLFFARSDIFCKHLFHTAVYTQMDTRQLKFEALVNAYSAELYRYAYWLTQHAVLAEDLVQEAFLRAWRALDSLRDADAAKAWLFTILRREIARHFAKNTEHTLSLEQDMPDEQLATPDPGLAHIDNLIVQQALARLPLIYREPLLLQVLNGYSCEEIAKLLGITAGTVMTRLCRARQQMRLALGEAPAANKPYGEHA
jgi:RNA polymerase sigma-70 factor, ECF subfamily